MRPPEKVVAAPGDPDQPQPSSRPRPAAAAPARPPAGPRVEVAVDTDRGLHGPSDADWERGRSISDLPTYLAGTAAVRRPRILPRGRRWERLPTMVAGAQLVLCVAGYQSSVYFVR